MPNNNAVALRPNHPIKDITTCRSLFTGFLPDIEKAMAGKMNPDVLMSAMVNSIRKNPGLLDCNQGSMVSALMHCADAGLIPDTPSQECHLIPFGKNVVWMAGFRGLHRKVRESGEIVDIETRAVYEKDEFSYNYGLHPDLIHVPYEDPANRGDSVYFYAIARFRDQQIPPKFEVMARLEVEKIRASSRSGKSDAWVKHFDEMGRKTVLRRIAKGLPTTPSLAVVIDLDNKASAGATQQVHSVVAEVIEEAADKRTSTEKLADDLESQNGDTPKTESKAELIKVILLLEDGNDLGNTVPDMRVEHVGFVDFDKDEVDVAKLTAYCEFLKLEPSHD